MGVGRSRECSSVGMTLLVADTDSITSTRSRALSLLQHPEQSRVYSILLLDTGKVN